MSSLVIFFSIVCVTVLRPLNAQRAFTHGDLRYTHEHRHHHLCLNETLSLSFRSSCNILRMRVVKRLYQGP
jgi:hypothetical protein